jgi:hypothetical protein
VSDSVIQPHAGAFFFLMYLIYEARRLDSMAAVFMPVQLRWLGALQPTTQWFDKLLPDASRCSCPSM